MSDPSPDDMEQRLLKLADALQSRFANTTDDRLTPPERVFRCVWELEAEVNNGGFSQYFLNSSGRHAPDAPAALRAIRAGATAALVEKALKAVGDGILWGDDARRQEAIERAGDALEARLDPLDTKFYAYPDDLTALLYRYVDEHRSEFPAEL